MGILDDIYQNVTGFNLQDTQQKSNDPEGYAQRVKNWNNAEAARKTQSAYQQAFPQQQKIDLYPKEMAEIAKTNPGLLGPQQQQSGLLDPKTMSQWQMADRMMRTGDPALMQMGGQILQQKDVMQGMGQSSGQSAWTPSDLRKEFDYSKYTPESVALAERHLDPQHLRPAQGGYDIPKMRKDIESLPEVKDWAKQQAASTTLVRNGKKMLQNFSTGREPSRQEQLSFIVDWYKMVDPDSTVTSTEATSAASDPSILGWARSMYQQAKAGSKMKPDAIASMMQDAVRRGTVRRELVQQLERDYAENAMPGATPQQIGSVFWRSRKDPEWWGKEYGTSINDQIVAQQAAAKKSASGRDVVAEAMAAAEKANPRRRSQRKN